MAVETTKAVKLTLAFKDATSRILTFNGVDDEALPQVKAKVKALNANMPPALATTFVSTIGAQLIAISKAQIIITEEEVIYSAS